MFCSILIFTIPNTTIIKKYSYLVLCQNINTFSKLYPLVNNCVGSFNFVINKKIYLYNNKNILLDSKTDIAIPLDKLEYTLELKDYMLDRTKAFNWILSVEKFGTPGRVNSRFKYVIEEDPDLGVIIDINDIHITELMAVNKTTIKDDDNEYSDWFELYNPTDNDYNLNDWSFTDTLGDAEVNLRKWVFTEDFIIKAKERIVMFASDKDRLDSQNKIVHLSFKLSGEGETLGLVTPDGVIKSRIEFPPMRADQSYGVSSEGVLGFLKSPSPNQPNSNVSAGLLRKITFSQTSGFYDSSFFVKLSSEDNNVIIRYTLDGKEPTSSSQIYNQDIYINKTSFIRAKGFKNNWVSAPSTSVTFIYLEEVIRQTRPSIFPASRSGNKLDYNMDIDILNKYGATTLKNALKDIPTISMVIDLKHLFDSSTGIYVNARQHGKEWEKEGSIELIDHNGQQGFQINCGIRIRGGYSRSGNNPKHAFRLFFRGDYEDNLYYNLFGDEGSGYYEKVDLRTSQNYSWAFGGPNNNTMVREVFSRDIQGLMQQSYARSRYYHLYINGCYWGIFQTQERQEARFSATYFGGNDDDYDCVKHGSGAKVAEATDGNKELYEQLYALTKNLRTELDNDIYLRMQGLNVDRTPNPEYPKLLEPINLADFMLIEYWAGDRDGPGSRYTTLNNFYSNINRVNPRGFKWYQHDSEHSLGTGDNNMVEPFTTSGAQKQYFNPHWLHEQLATYNNEYRSLFIDRIYKHLFNDGVLTTTNALNVLNNRAKQIENAI